MENDSQFFFENFWFIPFAGILISIHRRIERDRKRAWGLSNPDKVIAHRRKYLESHREKIQEYHKKYHKKHYEDNRKKLCVRHKKTYRKSKSTKRYREYIRTLINLKRRHLKGLKTINIFYRRMGWEAVLPIDLRKFEEAMLSEGFYGEKNG